MNKSQLIDAIAADTGLTKTDSRALSSRCLDTVRRR